MSKNNSNSLDQKSFVSLRSIYLLAFGIIAFLVIISQIFIQKALSKSDSDAFIINTAGRQRMLSQNISKNILLLKSSLNSHKNTPVELNQLINEWEQSHFLLKKNLSSLPQSNQKQELQIVFNQVDIQIKALIKLGRNILNYGITDVAAENLSIQTFLVKESSFLETMNNYVNNYEKYAAKKLSKTKTIEYLTFCLIILLLFAEIIVLFRPAASKIRATIKELVTTKNEAIELAKKANITVKQKNETLAELQLLQKAINQTLFFARIDKHGTILSSGKRMEEILNKHNYGHKHIIYENLGLSESDQIILKDLIASEKGTLFHHEFNVDINNVDIKWLDISVFPFIKTKGITEYLLVCLDISKRKIAQRKIEALNVEKMKAETAIQKSKASLIVEAQEEERKRIAKDIHDSIGQMLTALKFNMESLNLNQPKILEKRINILKSQTKDIILGVRMATFNLTPPELLDYGIVIALQKMVTQLNKFSKSEIIYESNISDNIRFDTLVETNLYRVTQESVNNSIKYANAEFILITVKKTNDLLSISVTDNGKGFNVNKTSKNPKGGSEGGMGLFFMKERMEYINGRIFINSSDQGTRVVINYPISN